MNKPRGVPAHEFIEMLVGTVVDVLPEQFDVGANGTTQGRHHLRGRAEDTDILTPFPDERLPYIRLLEPLTAF